jgi:hypothetical protein
MPSDKAAPTAEMRVNATRVRQILVRRAAELQSIQDRTPEQETDLAKLRAAISNLDSAWQPTAQA